MKITIECENEQANIMVQALEDFKKAIDALEKQIPKKPHKVQDISEEGYVCYEHICDSCGTEIDELVEYYCPNFCPNCGQAIDWEE